MVARLLTFATPNATMLVSILFECTSLSGALLLGLLKEFGPTYKISHLAPIHAP
jgi:hypothetical protein